ncbi:MAG TPA: cysteine desulfurase family protein [Trueperaceae bacterium]
MNIYLDYAATTPLDPEVLDAMLPAFHEGFANPSSLHQPGQTARRMIETAREQVAAAIGATPREITFTSGATEADNHALRAVAAARPHGHILTSQLEHSAVLATSRFLEQQGHNVTYLRSNAQGEITPDAVAAKLGPDTALVALMLVNNETGIITDIPAISQLAHEAGALVFCDAVQAFGTLPLDVHALDVDLLSLSAHKIHGPKGAGALYIRNGLELGPFLLGGEQERGRRAGTQNTPAIAGMGKAAELAAAFRQQTAQEVGMLRDRLQAKLLEIEGVSLNGGEAPRGPKHLNVRVRGVDGEALLIGLDQAGVSASAGSACAAGTLEPSHVLLAMGLREDEARSSLRFSLGRGLRETDIDEAAQRFAEVVWRCRAFAPH